jgi:stearoyl-CoA desaturase (Delta-9 desaturase)
VLGRRRYATNDNSRNSWLIAIWTLGEGWHNNHHHYMTSANQGWRWWEYDPPYYVLKALSWTGLVWDVRSAPAHVVGGVARRRAPAPLAQPGAARTVE